jgi:predicted DNA-binding transcriptional regulator YafY
MGDTPGRMLRLLALLQHRRSWSGAELADRLGVTDRTVRRDVDRLRALGYPVEAAAGAGGGYQLGRGGQLPPLLLGDEEAVAVALGLRVAVDGSVTGLDEAAVSVLGRLDQLLPAHLAARVRAVHASTVQVDRPQREVVGADLLIGLAQACGKQVRVRFEYADRSGQRSERLVEPYRLVRVGPRWYLVARDLDRRDWRTFRVDRLAALDVVGTPFELTERPDAAELVRRGLSARSWPFEARLRIAAPPEEVARMIPQVTSLVAADDGAASVVELGSTSAERMLRYLAGLPLPCRVLDPPELRVAVAAHAEALAAANR